MGPVLYRMLKDLGEAHPSVGEVRSIGLFGIIELVKDRKQKSRWLLEQFPACNGAFAQELPGARTVCLHPWHTVLIIPPLPITEAQLAGGVCGAGQGAK